MDINYIKETIKNRPVGVVGKRKEFAVLVPLVETPEGISVILEVRSGNIRQPGDICFPGGKIEDGEDILTAALRETYEEIGISPDKIEIFGQFDSVLEVNRVRMHTVVGLVSKNGYENMELERNEVEEVLTIPLKFFTENKPDYFRGRIIQATDDFPFDEQGIDRNYKWREAFQDFYFWHYNGKCIWGITALVLQWFIEEIIEPEM